MILKRVIAMLIDFYISLLITLPLFAILLINNKNDFIINILIIILLLLKDLTFKNQSIGKKLMKIEIKKLDNSNPKVYELILRNIFLPIWPLGFIMLILVDKTIGDILFNTKVVEKNKK